MRANFQVDNFRPYIPGKGRSLISFEFCFTLWRSLSEGWHVFSFRGSGEQCYLQFRASNHWLMHAVCYITTPKTIFENYLRIRATDCGSPKHRKHFKLEGQQRWKYKSGNGLSIPHRLQFLLRKKWLEKKWLREMRRFLKVTWIPGSHGW